MSGRKWLALATAAGLSVAAFACGDSGGGGAPPTEPSSNEAPSATIAAPADSAERSTSETVVLEGSASDPEEGDLSGSALAWSSDRDGELGTGRRVEAGGLSVGGHQITLTATDSEGSEGEDEVVLWVARPVQTGQPVEDVAAEEGDGKLFQITLGASASGGASSRGDAGQAGGEAGVPGDRPEVGSAQASVGPDAGDNAGSSASPPAAATSSDQAAAAEGEVLVVRLAGGSGDADLYVRLGEAPTTSTFDCRSAGPDNEEACRIRNPADGTWYVLARAASGFSGVTMTAALEAAEGGSGTLEVSASTTGEDPDADGYTVTVDPGTEGERSASLAPDGSVTFDNLAAGEHTVRLEDVAGNCEVTDGARSRTVTVPDGGTASESYAVSCPATTGALEASVSTTGGSPDPDGYTVQLSGPESASQTVDVNGTATFGGLAEGGYTVDLTGLADNCRVTDGDPKSATVTAGETATTGFSVECNAPPSADLSHSPSNPEAGETVTFDASGSSDPDGSITEYRWDLDGDGAVERTTTSATTTHSYENAGDVTATVTVVDDDGATDEAATTVSVVEGSDPLEIVTSSPLPEATEDDPYRQPLEATGGSGGGYTWRLVSGALPTGLELSSDGTISGEPESDDARFTVEVQDSQGATARKTFDLPVNMEPDVTILRPRDGLKATDETLITFEGSASDPEGTPIIAYEWFRSDGGTPVSLGTGSLIETTLPPGTHPIWLGVEAEDGLEAVSETITVEVADTDLTGYDVAFRFDADVPASVRDAMEVAGPAWEAVIVDDEPDYLVSDPDGVGCVPPMDEVVDDVVVFVQMEDIDGDGGVVARAGPRHIRSSGDGNLPLTGCITVDNADTDLPSADLQGVMEHETGHVLGMPFLWQVNDMIAGSGTDDPIFTGSRAAQAFLDVGGDTYEGDPVPLEAGNEAHWRESVFGDELMTPSFIADGVIEPLSRVTAASLADVGYGVDLDAADPYSLDAAAVLEGQPEGPSVDFGDDLLPGPVAEVPAPGAGER